MTSKIVAVGLCALLIISGLSLTSSMTGSVKIDDAITTGSATDLTCLFGTAATIDGDYNATEWSDADNYTVTGEVNVFAKHDSTYAYFCVIAYMDTTAGGFLDIGYFGWDTAYNRGR